MNLKNLTVSKVLWHIWWLIILLWWLFMAGCWGFFAFLFLSDWGGYSWLRFIGAGSAIVGVLFLFLLWRYVVYKKKNADTVSVASHRSWNVVWWMLRIASIGWMLHSINPIIKLWVNEWLVFFVFFIFASMLTINFIKIRKWQSLYRIYKLIFTWFFAILLIWLAVFSIYSNLNATDEISDRNIVHFIVEAFNNTKTLMASYSIENYLLLVVMVMWCICTLFFANNMIQYANIWVQLKEKLDVQKEESRNNN